MSSDPQIDSSESSETQPQALGEPEGSGQAAAAAQSEPSSMQPVSGRYRFNGAEVQLELRVDVDGNHPLKQVSGDFFATSGGTTGYSGSFVVTAPTITQTESQVVISGSGDFTWSTSYPIVRVTIPRTAVGQPLASATLERYNTADELGESFLCPFVSRYFRAVELEQDSVAGAVSFVSYDTGSLPGPPGSPARVLTVPRAYEEAGIQLMVAGTANVIADNADGWTEAEMHDAMQTHFSMWQDVPQWKLWLLVASRYEGDEGTRGIMFDFDGPYQRQGCAVFYDQIKGADAETQRAQLRTYVHELGHAFNLLHSWNKDAAMLGPNQGLGDLSWMNYAWRYDPGGGAPAGEAAYYASFPFQFTDNELRHLRHGFYRNVIPGANNWDVGAADIDPEPFNTPMADESGLRLELRAKGAFEFGEPVVIELKLDTTDLRGRLTHGYLHPNGGQVSVAIRQPSGRTVMHRPLLRRCVDKETSLRLDTSRPAIYSSAYIGYGRDGHHFQQPGTYLLRATYIASDGSRVVSPVLRLTVRYPLAKADEQVAELMMGEEQGTLFTLLGSDSPTLRSGNNALQEIIERHPKHPLATYARMVKGINAEREFKSLTPDKTDLAVRPPDPKESIQQLSPVVEGAAQGKGVDNITLNMVMRRLARAQARQGDLEEADAVLDRMVRHFTTRKLNQHVVDRVRDQAAATKAKLAAEFGT